MLIIVEEIVNTCAGCNTAQQCSKVAEATVCQPCFGRYHAHENSQSVIASLDTSAGLALDSPYPFDLTRLLYTRVHKLKPRSPLRLG